MPPPVLLRCDAITKSFGSRPLFEGLTFTLHEGEHVGLVGPNGAGKSTFLKILAGVDTPDSGTCSRRKNLRVGYAPQTPVFDAGSTAEGVVAAVIAGGARLDEDQRRQRVGLALSKAGFHDPGVSTDTLSGGWRARLAIARELALEPDVLLLDEPTNHLDIDSILWLESLLRKEARAFIVVGHDRYFFESVARRMLEINRIHAAGLFHVNGSYADFLEARDAALRNQEAYRETLANFVRREVAWLRRGAKARSTKQKARIQSAESGIRQLARVEERSAVSTAGIDFTSSGRKTKRLWFGAGLSKSFGETKIVEGLDLLLTPGMRLGVVGPNGSGKTTLLRMIVGEVEPDAGEVRHAEGLRVVYFDQGRESLDPALTLERALAPEGDGVVYRGRALHVKSWAKRFLFDADQFQTPVSRLSGGERARIMLARVMLQPADLLVLDEPTNDLDIPTLDVLEESLLDFPGALVLVTHDRYMIDRVSTRILALDGCGGVTPFADYHQWEQERRPQPSTKKRKAPAAQPAAQVTRRLSYLEQREWDSMEDEVLAAEAERDEAHRRAEDPSIATDAAALERRLAELEESRTRVDRLYARWAELEEKQK